MFLYKYVIYSISEILKCVFSKHFIRTRLHLREKTPFFSRLAEVFHPCWRNHIEFQFRETGYDTAAINGLTKNFMYVSTNDPRRPQYHTK